LGRSATGKKEEEEKKNIYICIYQTFQIRYHRKLAPLHVLGDIYCLKQQFVTFFMEAISMCLGTTKFW
jgi:hypothetical protein